MFIQYSQGKGFVVVIFIQQCEQTETSVFVYLFEVVASWYWGLLMNHCQDIMVHEQFTTQQAFKEVQVKV